MVFVEMKQLLKGITYKQIVGNTENEVLGIEMNSKLVKKNDCFVCIKGYTVDGHRYIDAAIEQGASVIFLEDMPEQIVDNVLYVQVEDTGKTVAALASYFYEFPSQKVRSIGVTGTNGKTTIANMINDALRNLGEKTAVMGTLGIDIDGEKIESPNTTADALTIQKTYRRMVEKKVDNAVLEVSSHGLSLGRLDGVEFQTAIFTNLTQDHLDFHKTMDEYAYAKGKLFSGLGHAYSKNKTAILNADDDRFDFYKALTTVKVVSYGIRNQADIMATDITYDSESTSFTLITNAGAEVITTNFIGEFNVYNVLAAIAALLDKGYSVEEIKKTFKKVFPVDGRMEKVQNKEGYKIYIDYAHTPDGIEKALQGMRHVTDGKVYCVIGAGGNRDREKRPIMAGKASEGADFVVLTTDNPRDESRESIMADMVKGMKHENFVAIGDRKEAIFECLKLVTKNDAVIIAGKGPEDYQIVKGEKIPFNDKETVIDFFNR